MRITLQRKISYPRSDDHGKMVTPGLEEEYRGAGRFKRLIRIKGEYRERLINDKIEMCGALGKKESGKEYFLMIL